jgi:hypothetical protein
MIPPGRGGWQVTPPIAPAQARAARDHRGTSESGGRRRLGWHAAAAAGTGPGRRRALPGRAGGTRRDSVTGGLPLAAIGASETRTRPGAGVPHPGPGGRRLARKPDSAGELAESVLPCDSCGQPEPGLAPMPAAAASAGPSGRLRLRPGSAALDTGIRVTVTGTASR